MISARSRRSSSLPAAHEADAEGRVTITEIAQQAGVSVPTVSVSSTAAPTSPRRPAPGSRTCCAARATASAPSSSASRAVLLDLVFNDLGSPWALGIIRGVEEAAAQAAGAGTVVSAIRGRSGNAREWTRNLPTHTSDGVLLVTSAMNTLREELRVLGIPLGVVDPAGSPASDVPTIGPAGDQMALGAIEALRGRG